MPGPTNVVADALSRYAYPATSAREDVSFHGSEEARQSVKKMIEQELRDRALVGVVRVGDGGRGFFGVGGACQVARPYGAHVRVLTRSGRGTGSSPLVPPAPACQLSPEDESSDDEIEEINPPENPSRSGTNEQPATLSLKWTYRPKGPEGGGKGRPRSQIGQSRTTMKSLKSQFRLLPSPVVVPVAPAGPMPVPGSRRFAFTKPGSRPSSPTPARRSRTTLSRAPRLPVPHTARRGPSALATGSTLDPEAPEWYPPTMQDDEEESGGDPVQPSAPPNPIDSLQATRLEELRTSVMDADWATAYANSACWAADWQLVNAPGPDWPKGVKVFGNKMFLEEKLCVPEDFVPRVVREHHEAVGHVVGKRFLSELTRRYRFPGTTDFRTRAEQVRKECLVCQAAEPPTYSLKEEVYMTPVPDGKRVLGYFFHAPHRLVGPAF